MKDIILVLFCWLTFYDMWQRLHSTYIRHASITMIHSYQMIIKSHCLFKKNTEVILNSAIRGFVDFVLTAPPMKKGPSLTKTQHHLHSVLHHQCDQPLFSINATSLQGVTTFPWLLFFSFTLLFQVARLHAGGKCLHLALVPPSHTFEFWTWCQCRLPMVGSWKQLCSHDIWNETSQSLDIGMCSTSYLYYRRTGVRPANVGERSYTQLTAPLEEQFF